MKNSVALTILAAVFAVALTFGSVEIPALLNRSLELVFGKALFPQGIWSGPNETPSEIYIRKHFLRPVGYACLIGVMVLIVSGLLAERRRLAFAGALLFFLPVFGHFAIQMFFLAGLGVLRLIWMPLLDSAYGLTGDSEFWPSSPGSAPAGFMRGRPGSGSTASAGTRSTWGGSSGATACSCSSCDIMRARTSSRTGGGGGGCRPALPGPAGGGVLAHESLRRVFGAAGLVGRPGGMWWSRF